MVNVRIKHFTPKELKLLREMIDFAVNSIIERYEMQWLNNNITDRQFDERWKLWTKLGYNISSRKELNEF